LRDDFVSPQNLGFYLGFRKVSIETLKRTLFLGVPRMNIFFILSKNKNKATHLKTNNFLK